MGDALVLLVNLVFADSHFARPAHLITDKRNPIRSIAGTSTPFIREFGFGFPERGSCPPPRLDLSHAFERMRNEPMAHQLPSIGRQVFLALIVVRVHQKDVITIADEKPMWIRHRYDGLVDDTHHDIDDDAGKCTTLRDADLSPFMRLSELVFAIAANFHKI